MKKFILVFIVSITLFSCKSHYFLSPIESTNQTYKGVPAVVQEKNGIEVKMSYAYYDERAFYYDIYIINKSDQAIQIIPNSSFYVFYDKDITNNRELRWNYFRKYYAANPQLEVINIEKSREQAKSNHTAGQVLSVVNLLAGTAHTTTSNTSSETKVADGVSNIFYFIGDYKNNERNYEETIKYLDSEDDFWRKTALHNIKLQAGKSISGVLVYPRTKDIMKFYRVVLPINDIDFFGDFIRIKVEK